MMRGTLVPVVLVSMCCAGMVVESRTSNRNSDGYQNSGYAWPKTILWHGIRSPPGSLWFFYFFLAWMVVTTCFYFLLNVLCKRLKIDLQNLRFLNIDTIAAYQAGALGTGLLYLSLGVMNLSDVMEAYLAGMVSVQVILSTPRLPGNKFARMFSMNAFQVSAVFGIAMLDSYHPLNLLNGVYSAVASLIIVILYCTEDVSLCVRAASDTILSIVQMVFSIIAYLVASDVEGTHRTAMLAILVTACVFTGIARIGVYAVDSDLELDSGIPSPSAAHDQL